MKIGILGYGEIGQAIEKIYQNRDDKPLIKDLKRDDGLFNLDILNICIPHNQQFDFIDVVVDIAKSSNAKIVIIHSTVAVGTTRKIKNQLKNTFVAHSPCRGIHPNLFEGLLTFVKYVGAINSEDANEVSQHLSLLGIKTYICKNPESSELAKLLDTTYYGLCIAYHGEAVKACEKFNASFEDVMTMYNSTYNEGYNVLGKTNVIRPVLTPPINGIGGHCVIQNAELLKKQFDSLSIDLILSHKPK